jgi:carbon-monoxide dehydrogenase medium subunit
MKPLPIFDYHRPTTIEEAVDLLNSLDGAKPLIGGTDLVPTLREGVLNVTHLVDLNLIPEMRYIRENDGYICIGATTTLNQISSSPIIKKRAHALHEASSRIGSPQIRNLGTVTGNLCNASPAADSAPPLLVLDAELTIESVHGVKKISVDKLFAGPKINSLKPNELVTEIRFPVPPANTGSAYHKIGRRKAFTLSVVGAATYVEMDGDFCQNARFAFGSVAETPIRAKEAEEIIKGKEISLDLIGKISERCKEYVHPIDDVRGTAEYRKDMCAVLLKRALKQSLEVARWKK